MLGEKEWWSVLKFHEAPHTAKLLNYMGCLVEFYTSFNTILYENEFQNTQIFQQNSLFPEQSTF
jgi:hypothetical protein